MSILKEADYLQRNMSKNKEVMIMVKLLWNLKASRNGQSNRTYSKHPEPYTLLAL